MKLGSALFFAGLPGVIVVALFIIPAVVRFTDEKPSVPLPVIILVTILQSSVLLALAVWAGVALSPKVGLSAPMISGLIASSPVSVRPALLGGLAGGVLGGIFLVIAGRLAPPDLAAVENKLSPPLPVRILYGGITEEVLTRWGLMSLLLWVGWRFLQGGAGTPRSGYAWAAIVVSAVIFGLGHLPMTAALVGKLSGAVIAYVVGANTIFGIMAGYLFWQHGLDAAIIAHASAHIVGWAGETLWRLPSV